MQPGVAGQICLFNHQLLEGMARTCYNGGTPGSGAKNAHRFRSPAKGKFIMENALRALTPFLDERGRLTALPVRQKKKLLALWYLSEKIDAERQYREEEINDLLDAWTAFHDPATLRRELYNRHLLNRTANCALYWKEAEFSSPEDFIAKNI